MIWDAVLEGFTGEQRFFLGWAQVYRQTALVSNSAHAGQSGGTLAEHCANLGGEAIQVTQHVDSAGPKHRSTVPEPDHHHVNCLLDATAVLTR